MESSKSLEEIKAENTEIDGISRIIETYKNGVLSSEKTDFGNYIEKSIEETDKDGIQENKDSNDIAFLTTYYTGLDGRIIGDSESSMESEFSEEEIKSNSINEAKSDKFQNEKGLVKADDASNLSKNSNNQDASTTFEKTDDNFQKNTINTSSFTETF